jgi:hypothetical protein
VKIKEVEPETDEQVVGGRDLVELGTVALDGELDVFAWMDPNFRQFRGDVDDLRGQVAVVEDRHEHGSAISFVEDPAGNLVGNLANVDKPKPRRTQKSQ